ncbi:MAG TPA: HAD family hydrolase [Ramlibacter sp.]
MQPTFTPPLRAACFDWGGTLMSEAGPADLPMGTWPEVRAVAGARDALALLHGHLPLCIATNASVSDVSQIERALARVGLAQFFSHIFCYTDLGCRKDDPGFWRAVSERLDLPATSIAMVGDSLEQDVLGPARFGVQSVWFSATAAHVERDVPRVAQLPQFARLVLQAL